MNANNANYEWIDTTADFDSFLASLAGVERIGIDTEFHRESRYWPELALVQIAAGDRNVLIDPLAVDVSGLGAVIAGEVVTIMHAGEQDIELLYRICGTIPSQLIDIQIVAGFVGLSTPSLSALVDRFTQEKISKGNRLANWLQRPLTGAQCQYAASDVAFLFEICDRLFAELEKSGRLQWALSECELARKPPPPPVEPMQAWYKIKAARQLRGQARVVACALAAWRERTARDKNIPPRFVLNELALVDIAQRRPTDENGLKSLRGQGSSLGKSATKAVLEQVRRGLEMDPADVPLPQSKNNESLPADLRAAVSLVSAWLDELANSQQLDRSLLATRNDVERLLLGNDTSRLSQGWRADLVGPTVTDLVNGRAVIAFDRASGLSIEPRQK